MQTLLERFSQYAPSLAGWAGVFFVLWALATIVFAVLLRRVVSTNMVHIVQRRRKTTPYGTGQEAGNVYYHWPSWVPWFGVTVITLPVSNFDLSLKGYEAYDKDRVPFDVDVVSFFRIANTALAAQRVYNIAELKEQLLQIVQGAVRKVLASAEIDTIMVERAEFGTAFTGEVTDQVLQWGVEPVKSMELMDIRDSGSNRSIANIMAKKISHIDMQSRTEVARNKQQAETAEIEARQAVDIRKQEAEQMVGERTAAKSQAVGIAEQASKKAVLDAEVVTQSSQMEVLKVQQVRQAEITKEQQIVTAEQGKQTAILEAEGKLEAKKREAEAIKTVGEAEGAAATAKLMAPVDAQIKLAKEIGANGDYQKYLVTIEAIKAHVEVGSKQAEALQKANVKVIANTGNPTNGMKNVMDMFSSTGGTAIGGMVEAFAQTPIGEAIMAKLANLKPNGAIPNEGPVTE